jgi:hypothetical protein
MKNMSILGLEEVFIALAISLMIFSTIEEEGSSSKTLPLSLEMVSCFLGFVKPSYLKLTRSSCFIHASTISSSGVFFFDKFFKDSHRDGKWNI